jgi:hypothetical protein
MIRALSGIWGARLGWAGRPPASWGAHGPLMVSGFLGTVICQRAVALGGAGLSGPLATGLGTSPCWPARPPRRHCSRRRAPSSSPSSSSRCSGTTALHMAVMAGRRRLARRTARVGGNPVPPCGALVGGLPRPHHRRRATGAGPRPAAVSRRPWRLRRRRDPAGGRSGHGRPDARRGHADHRPRLRRPHRLAARHDVARRTVRAEGLTASSPCACSGYAYWGGQRAARAWHSTSGGVYDALLRDLRGLSSR